MNLLYNIDDKYKYDFEIISITFNYYEDTDLSKFKPFPPKHLLYPPQLILLCKSSNFNEKKEFIGYNYFKLIFVKPSTYNINLTNNQSIYNILDNNEYSDKINYEQSLPCTCNIKEAKIAPNHYKWEILFKKESTERGYIIIYADKLEIQHLDKLPTLNTNKITNQNLHINNIDDKYKYDFEIISITFNYWKDEDFDDANNDLVNPPQLILLCKSSNFNEKKEFIGYNYFKLIFIKPSIYNIHVKPKPYDSTADLTDIELMTRTYINYLYSSPLISEIKETQTAPNHSKWEISLKHHTKEEGYIRIYSDKLQIIDLEKQPDLS